MKIALIIEHYDATRGGAEAITVWLAGQLAARGHEVHVVCHDAKSRLRRAAHHGASHDATRSEHSHPVEMAAPPDGITIHRLRGVKLSTAVGFRLFGLQVKRLCRRLAPDLVHSVSVAFAGDIYHPEAGSYVGLQQAAVESRSSPRQAALKRFFLRLPGKSRTLVTLERAAVAPPADGGARKIICISQMMTEEFKTFYDLPDTRLFRLDNPRMTDLPDLAESPALREWFRSHYGMAAADRVAVFVGHDFRRKGLWWALQAIHRCREPWKLLVVGLGKTRTYLDLVQRLGLQSRVIFVGPTRQTNAIYAAADALVLPTFYDSFGLVALEALSFGLPVIATRRLGCYPLVTDHDLGAIVDSPRDTEAMAAALDALPGAGSNRDALVARARAAAAGLSPAGFMDRLEGLYAEVAGQKKRRVLR